MYMPTYFLFCLRLRYSLHLALKHRYLSGCLSVCLPKRNWDATFDSGKSCFLAMHVLYARLFNLIHNVNVFCNDKYINIYITFSALKDHATFYTSLYYILNWLNILIRDGYIWGLFYNWLTFLKHMYFPFTFRIIDSNSCKCDYW